jgi:hypothetical protein
MTQKISFDLKFGDLQKGETKIKEILIVVFSFFTFSQFFSTMKLNSVDFFAISIPKS